MDREERGALLRSGRMDDKERLVVGWRFRIQHVNPPDDDDENSFVQLDGIAGDGFHISWPNCPFHTDEVIPINNETLGCKFTYWC